MKLGSSEPGTWTVLTLVGVGSRTSCTAQHSSSTAQYGTAAAAAAAAVAAAAAAVQHEIALGDL
jgi:hypothetical protein